MSSVFTKEDAGPLPEFVDRVYDATLENITIRLEDVQKKLKHLNVNKSTVAQMTCTHEYYTS